MYTTFRYTPAAIAALVGLLTVAPAAATAQTPGGSDPKAIEVADQMMAALGGEDNWTRMRFIKFTFIRGQINLTLTWDKWTGRYRLDATTQEGQPYVVLMNINTRAGDVYLDGQKLDGEERDTYLGRAARIWKGETYWFLMPFKLHDPGVVLTYEGEETADDTAYDIVHVSFNGPGMAADQFWAYVNQDTHLMDKWRYRLSRGAEGEFWWKNWERYGPLLMSTLRENAEGATIRMEDIIVTDTMSDEMFTTP